MMSGCFDYVTCSGYGVLKKLRRQRYTKRMFFVRPERFYSTYHIIIAFATVYTVVGQYPQGVGDDEKSQKRWV